MTGALVLVGTPIGNLGDLSPRAVAELAAADVIVCEDTRRTRKLLTHAGVHGVRLVVMHEHNERQQVPRLVDRARAGARVAVVTDAGMPGIADPGERLVAAAARAGVPVEVVPGPSAAITALVASGLPAGRFVFEGFLPRKGPARAERLAAVAAERRTTVLYEAPHRLRHTLDDLGAACGPHRTVAVARELTKLFEEVWRGDLAAAAARFAEEEPRGEIVLVVAGAPAPAPASADEVAEALRERLGAGEDKKAAIAAVARDLDVPKRSVYEVATRL